MLWLAAPQPGHSPTGSCRHGQSEASRVHISMSDCLRKHHVQVLKKSLGNNILNWGLWKSFLAVFCFFREIRIHLMKAYLVLKGNVHTYEKKSRLTLCKCMLKWSGSVWSTSCSTCGRSPSTEVAGRADVGPALLRPGSESWLPVEGSSAAAGRLSTPVQDSSN